MQWTQVWFLCFHEFECVLVVTEMCFCLCLSQAIDDIGFKMVSMKHWHIHGCDPEI